MKKLSKTVNIITLLMISIFLFSSSVTCNADEPRTINGPDLSITITEIDEDGINVDIGFINNPGVGAMTFTIMYDTSCFKVTGEYNAYGYFYTPVGITGYGVVDHPDRGYVSFVQADGGNTNLFKGTGTFLTLQFKVTGKTPGKHWFKIANINPMQRGEDLEGCFADFEHNKFIATAKNDYYYIPATDDNPCTNHDYVLVNKVAPSCTSDGYSLYRCTICEKTKKSNIVQAKGHDFDTKWTVDREGGNGVAKVVSRHCKNCGERTDIRYLSETGEMPEEVKNDEKKSSLPSSNNSGDTDSGKTINNPEDGKTTQSLADDLFSPEFAEDEFALADDIIESVKNGDYFYYGGIRLPNKVKTIGDFIAKTFVYLFGAGDQKGIITIVLNAITKVFL